MRLVAERLLRDGRGKTYVQGEITTMKLRPLPPPAIKDGRLYHVYVSRIAARSQTLVS